MLENILKQVCFVIQEHIRHILLLCKMQGIPFKVAKIPKFSMYVYLQVVIEKVASFTEKIEGNVL